jgi:hypothetical protein
MLKLGHSGKWIRNTWKVLKCGAEGWKRSVGLIVWEMKYYTESRRTGISYIQQKDGRLTGLVTSCVETAFWHERILEIEKGSTRSHSVQNCLRKRLWACRKADYGMNEYEWQTLLLTFVFCSLSLPFCRQVISLHSTTWWTLATCDQTQ